MPVHLIQSREVIQLETVKGIEQSLVDLHAPLYPAPVRKGQVVVGAGGIDAYGDDFIGVVLILPALGPGIGVLRMIAIHHILLRSV